jgi:hypothetical protein
VKRTTGYGLLQLLIAMSLAVILLGAFVTVHGRSRQAVNRLTSIAEVQDATIQAMAYVGEDLVQAGFVGLPGRPGRINGVAGPQDPVAIPVSGDCGPNFSVSLNRPVEGRNNRYDLACPAVGEPVEGADVLILRRLAGRPSQPESGRLQAVINLENGALFSDGGPAEFTAPVEVRDVVASIYYVARSGGQDGRPALRRKTLSRGPRLLDEEIAPGIADFQVLLGIDLDDVRGVDLYVHPDDPRAAGAATRVVAVRLWLLAEATAPHGTIARSISRYADRAGLSPTEHRSRYLLVQTLPIPNGSIR